MRPPRTTAERPQRSLRRCLGQAMVETALVICSVAIASIVLLTAVGQHSCTNFAQVRAGLSPQATTQIPGAQATSQPGNSSSCQ